MSDIETRGREAGRAAREAVAPIVDEIFARQHPRTRLTPARAFVGAGALTMTLVIVLGLMAILPDRSTTVSVGPVATTISPRPEPPDLPDPFPMTPLAEGTASDGRRWWLFVGGPFSDICLSAEQEVPEPVLPGSPPTTVFRPTACAAGSTFGEPDPDTFRPHQHKDVRVPSLVYGRMPEGVVAVGIELRGSPLTTPSVPVIEAEGGPYYVVELPADADALAAIGQRVDGTTVREPVR